VPPFASNLPARAGSAYGATKAARRPVEPARPVRDLHGESLVPGWQPEQLPAVIERQVAARAESGWQRA